MDRLQISSARLKRVLVLLEIAFLAVQSCPWNKMPLHLLSKKSWNVYSSANRARVARDEALAAAAQRDIDREQRDGESASTLSVLRDREERSTNRVTEKEKLLQVPAEEHTGSRGNRKRKRLPGEDDTDRDLRYAQERNEKLYGSHGTGEDTRVLKLRPDSRDDKVAPIVDKNGNINLFPEPKPNSTKPKLRTELEKEVDRQKNLEESASMHLKDATGRQRSDQSWYLDKDGRSKQFRGQDVWGNEDPRREERDARRIVSSDPLAMMQKAQLQLKEVRRDQEARARELKEMRKSRRSDERSDEPDLEDFSLDHSLSNTHRRKSRRRRSRSHSPRRHHDSERKHRRREGDSHGPSHKSLRHRSRSNSPKTRKNF